MFSLSSSNCFNRCISLFWTVQRRNTRLTLFTRVCFAALVNAREPIFARRPFFRPPSLEEHALYLTPEIRGERRGNEGNAARGGAWKESVIDRVYPSFKRVRCDAKNRNGWVVDKLEKHLWNATKCKLVMHTDDNSTDGKREESEMGEILRKSWWYDCKKSYASKK